MSLCTYLPSFMYSIYLSAYLGVDGDPPTHLGGVGHPPAYLLGDGHIYPQPI